MDRAPGWSRRRFLAASGAAALPVIASACGGGGYARPQGLIRWWDEFAPLHDLHEKMWSAFSSRHSDARVDYTQFDPVTLATSLPLAIRSGEAPDIFHPAGITVPSRALWQLGWFAPLENQQIRNDPLWKPNLFPGVHIFGGKVYSLPVLGSRWYSSLTWFDRNLMADAGVDPDRGPRTWDEMRTAARRIKKKSGKPAVILNLKYTDRIGTQVEDYAQLAGAPGSIDWRTGEYAYGRDEFGDALEFLLSLQKDGTLDPASSSQDARTGRALWAAGQAAIFVDGCWNAGVLKPSFPKFLPKVGVAPAPTPDATTAGHTYASPSAGTFWISSQSAVRDLASTLLTDFSTRHYLAGVAGGMDQPPVDLSVVPDSQAIPLYRQAVEIFGKACRIAPEPVIANPETSQVLSKMLDLHPNMGEIVQGAFSGDISDYRKALRDYAGKLQSERERLVKSVRATGADVSDRDWVFPDWKPGTDYTAENYAS